MSSGSGRLAGKVCLITGSSGIAEATARLAAREGADIFLAGLVEEECRALAAELGGDFLAADLTVAAAAKDAVERCVGRFGRLDALYNVAGISGRRLGDGPVHECTEEGWDATMAANVKSVFLMSRAAVTYFLEGRRPGAILNMASVLAFSPEPHFFATHAYAASKGAIISLSKAMAAYYAPHGIRVNAIAPGLVRTPMSRRAQGDPAILEFLQGKQPLAGTLIEPEDVARASVFLLSDEARMITGEVLTVDAGWGVRG